MNLRHFYAAALSICSAMPVQPAGASEARTALVVGNAHYSFSPLTNPANDAADMADALRAAGFEVLLKLDADQKAMLAAVAEFARTLKDKKGAGLFYFAGHGVQAGGENYFLPIGERPRDEGELKRASVNAAQVVEAMASAGNSLNVIVLDACRDNAVGKSGTRGLSRIDSNARLFVSFSTSPGEAALDGSGRNSPFTGHLAKAIRTPNLSIEDTFKQTLKGVYVETQGRQIPWISSSYFGEFVFRPPAEPVALTSPPFRRPALASLPSVAGVYRAVGVNPDGSRYRGMVALGQSGGDAQARWWIGKQYFSGQGHFAGRMLVVRWGGKHPVIYSFGENGALDGEWADGKASERLELFALASAGAPPLAEGRYRAEGRNPNGSVYGGSVGISRKGQGYHLAWTVGGESYQGDGSLEGGVLTVHWGSASPVVYALGADGRLKGLWSHGNGEETLSPER